MIIPCEKVKWGLLGYHEGRRREAEDIYRKSHGGGACEINHGRCKEYVNEVGVKR